MVVLGVTGQSDDLSQGRIESYVSSDGRTGALIEVRCNTVYVARNAEFVAFAQWVAERLAADPDALSDPAFEERRSSSRGRSERTL
jgi:translation elongation factor EF-Ts